MKKNYIVLLLAVAPLLSGVQYSKAFTYRPYLGISANYVLIAGNFDGETYFYIDDETILVPKLDPGFGFGINGGIRFQKGALDFQYKRSTHNCSLLGGTQSRANFNVIKFIGFKSYIGESKIIQPFIDFDFSGTWMRVADATYLESSPQVFKRATYGALILGLGGGLAVKFADKISLELEALPAWYLGTDVTGFRKNNYEIEKFNSFKFDVSAALIYYFKGK